MAKEKCSTSTTGKETQRPDVRHREQFKHAPLDKESRQIRVLDILPKLTPDGLVQCRQRTTTLDDSNDKVGNFRALSYEWGSPDSARHAIVINDGTLLVRSNLHDFLWAFRKKHSLRKPRLPLWIDAVCIDQENVSERSQQVTLMRDIYSKADEVLVWLGERDYRFHSRTLAIAHIAVKLRKVIGCDVKFVDTDGPPSRLKTAFSETQAPWQRAVQYFTWAICLAVPPAPESFDPEEITYFRRA